MEHEHSSRGDVDQAVEQAALGEVDLLAVPGRERQIEVADQLERAAANVHAVPDRGRQARTDAHGRANSAPAACSRS